MIADHTWRLLADGHDASAHGLCAWNGTCLQPRDQHATGRKPRPATTRTAPAAQATTQEQGEQ